MENTERSAEQGPSKTCIYLQNILRGLESLSNCMDQLALRTQLRQCDLIVCVGPPDQLEQTVEHVESTGAHHSNSQDGVVEGQARPLDPSLSVSHTKVREEGSGEEDDQSTPPPPRPSQIPKASLGEYSPLGGSLWEIDPLFIPVFPPRSWAFNKVLR
ncbi:uncharacterized protein AB9W97_006265 [Spinachia spinachia]